MDVDDVEPVVEVVAELLLLDAFLEVLVRRADDADIHLDRQVRADALELALLEDAQQLRLGRHGHLADLVEEDRALIGHLEAATALGHRTGERTLLMTEELGLEEGLWERSTRDLDERPGAAVRVEMERLGDELLAGAALAGDEDRRIGLGHLADGLVDLLHRG